MQNRYVGDVGDFGKYGLLRALCQPEGRDGLALQLGVVWYLTPDENHNNDGRHIGYLEPTAKNDKIFRSCDPDLYDTLADLVMGGARNVLAIRQSEVLPKGTVYYECSLNLNIGELYSNSAKRSQARREWVQDAVQAMENCDLVFVDPDNGIGSVAQAHSRRGAKYVLLEELMPYFNRGQSLIIYHHLNRSADANTQISRRVAELEKSLAVRDRIIALRYRRGSARVFFVVLSLSCLKILNQRISSFLRSPWSDHFYPSFGGLAGSPLQV